jgi:hypothetical protein
MVPVVDEKCWRRRDAIDDFGDAGGAGDAWLLFWQRSQCSPPASSFMCVLSILPPVHSSALLLSTESVLCALMTITLMMMTILMDVECVCVCVCVWWF